jgi:hypothetical protein
MRGAFVLLAALAVIASGCDNQESGKQEQVALKAVAATSRAQSVSPQFPPTPKSIPCVIRGGGPAPGIRVPGTCATLVTITGNGSAVVRFRETWDGHRFFGSGSSRRAGLTHTWEFTVTKAGLVRSNRDYGDFPPQWVH